MFTPGPEIYEFGEFTFDASERRLSKGSQPIALAPKEHDVLCALLRNAGRLVTKSELLHLVWPESFVEEGILAVHISALRKVLDDRQGGLRHIETVSRAGYRFIAAVTQSEAEHTARSGKQWSVAVLPARPFTGEMLSGRDRSTGLTIADVLIDRLGRFPQLIVRPTRAVHGYSASADDPAAIGRWLRVDAVIDMHFLGFADRVRVAVHLIRSLDGANLWSGTFDEPAAQIIVVAEQVAERVLEHLGSNPPAPESAPALPDVPPRDTNDAVHPASHAEVYELIGRGRHHLLSASIHELPKAMDAFRAATELDPGYAPAHAGMAMACCAQAAMRMVPPAQAYSEAKSAALRALAMDSSCADAQVALGAVLYFGEWNWAGAERSLKRALQLNPNHSEAYLLYGQLLETLGRLEEGLEAKLRALERDPHSPMVHLQISLSYWNQRRYDDVIEWANKTLALDPLHPHAGEYLAGAYWKKGDADRFLEQNLKHARLHGVPPELLEQLKQSFSAEGPAGRRKLALARASAEPQVLPAMQLALLYGQAGELDKAFETLTEPLRTTTRPWFTLRLRLNGTCCAAIRGSTSA